MYTFTIFTEEHILTQDLQCSANFIRVRTTEPDNPVDKFAVAVKKNQNIVGHLKKGKTGRFAKTLFYFLRSNPYSKCHAKVTGKRCNLGDGDGLQVPCIIYIWTSRVYDYSTKRIS